MPNHVTNWWSIELAFETRHDGRLTALREQIANPGEAITFEKIIPPPDHPAYRDEPNQHTAETEHPEIWWYNWNVKHWGTKWGAYQQAFDDTSADIGRLCLCFQTAWRFPEAIFRRVCQLALQHPEDKVRAVAVDEGDCFGFVAVATLDPISGGVRVDYHDINATVLDAIGDCIGSLHHQLVSQVEELAEGGGG